MESDVNRNTLVEFSKGSPVAFEKIYNKFQAFVFVSASRLLKCDADAKDMRSKCFLKLWEHRDKLYFETISQLFAWLKVCVYNNCIDHIRSVAIRHSKQPEVESRFWEENEIEEIFEVSDKEAVILERLLKQINQLPPKVRVVFKLRWLDDLKFREIAEIQGIDISAVKKRYARALVLLRKQNFNI